MMSMSMSMSNAAVAGGVIALTACACSAQSAAGCSQIPPRTQEPKKREYKEEVLPEARKSELTRRVDVWHAEARQPGTEMKPLHFESSLTAGERKFVHALCESRGGELSSKSEGKGRERHVVVFDKPVEEGKVGGVSATRRVELTQIFYVWDQDIIPLHFSPDLTTAEREFAHQLAARHGLKSKSEGKEHHGADWHIVVRRS